MFSREGAEQAHFQHPDFLAARQQFVNHLFAGADSRAHQNGDPFGLRMAVIFERLILTAGYGSEIIHRLFDMIVYRVIPRVGRLAGLEVSVRIRRSAADHRVLRVERPGAVRVNFSLRHQAANRVICQRDDFVDFMRGAETIKEVNKGNPAFQGRDLRDQCEILRFLYARGAQHGATGLADRHDVRMIAKNGQRVGCHGTGGDMQYKGVNCPASLYSVGIISSNPCEEVKEVASAPVCSAP